MGSREWACLGPSPQVSSPAPRGPALAVPTPPPIHRAEFPSSPDPVPVLIAASSPLVLLSNANDNVLGSVFVRFFF